MPFINLKLIGNLTKEQKEAIAKERALRLKSYKL